MATEQAKAASKQAVDTAVAEKLADANRAGKQSEAELLARAQQAESLKADAEEALRPQRIAQVVSEAKAKLSESENQLAALNLMQEAELAKSLEEQRVDLEKATEDAVNVERVKSFEDHQKLSTKVADLSRALERKTNEELKSG